MQGQFSCFTNLQQNLNPPNFSVALATEAPKRQKEGQQHKSASCAGQEESEERSGGSEEEEGSRKKPSSEEAATHQKQQPADCANAAKGWSNMELAACNTSANANGTGTHQTQTPAGGEAGKAAEETGKGHNGTGWREKRCPTTAPSDPAASDRSGHTIGLQDGKIDAQKCEAKATAQNGTKHGNWHFGDGTIG